MIYFKLDSDTLKLQLWDINIAVDQTWNALEQIGVPESSYGAIKISQVRGNEGLIRAGGSGRLRKTEMDSNNNCVTDPVQKLSFCQSYCSL